jgi:DNA-binding MarR family transcriptional regulator
VSDAPADQLRRAMQQLFRRFGALATDATPCGQPLSMAHAHALMVLAARGELTQQALGAELGVDKSNVARLCARLTAAGHVTQRRGEADGRQRLIALTARGAQLAARVDVASRTRFESLLAALPASRRRAVIDGLELLVAALAAARFRERTSG